VAVEAEGKAKEISLMRIVAETIVGKSATSLVSRLRTVRDCFSPDE